VDPANLSFPYFSHHAGFPILRELYSINQQMKFEDGGPVIKSLGKDLALAWFPTHIRLVNSAAEAAARMRQLKPEELRATVFSSVPARACPLGTVVAKTDVTQGLAELVTLTTEPGCLLIVSLNFSERLEAKAGAVSLPIFPLDGVLTGISVPAGETRITLAALPRISPRAERSLIWIGLVLGFAAILASWGKGLLVFSHDSRPSPTS
jgi:hypothetical protein